MRERRIDGISLIAVLILPALAAAYPADSTVLVRQAEVSASGDTLSWSRYEYARDLRGDWIQKQYQYHHDTLYFANIVTFDSVPRIIMDSMFNLDSRKGPTWSWERPDRYDAAGRILGISLMEGDSIVEVGEFQYDAAGNMLQSKLTPAQGAAYILRFEYDAQGRKTASRFSLGDSLVTVNHYLYDGNGRQVSDVLFNGKGDTLSTTSMEYDGAGRRIREVDRLKGDSLGILGSETRNEYDAAGHLVAVQSYGGNGALKSTELYVYERVEIPLGLAGPARRGPRRTGMGPASALSAAGRDALGRRLPFPTADRALAAGLPSVPR